MNRSYAGGCACGAIRYATESRPIAQNHCQCRDCQRRSGTGHGSYLTFARRSEVELTGTAATWRVTADNGNVKSHAFCPTCGTPVYLTLSDAPELIVFHATSLDDPGLFEPEQVLFGVRGHAWDAMDPALQKFERMPPR